MPLDRKKANLAGNKKERLLKLLAKLPADRALYEQEVLEAINISPPHLNRLGRDFKCSVLVYDHSKERGHNIRVYVNPKHLDKWQ